MPNSTKRDINGLSISKVCSRCEKELSPSHFNLPARCWDCEDEHKVDQKATDASKTPEERQQEALDKYQKEYSHLAQSQWELISILTAALERLDPGWAEALAEGAFSPSRGPNAIVENDGLIRRLYDRIADMRKPVSTLVVARS